jgi:hypothetical protein
MDTRYFLCSLILSSFLASGCATLTTQSVAEDHLTIKGTLAAPPVMQGSRLKLYFRPTAEGERILIAVVKNREDKAALARINQALLDTPQPIFLFGHPNHKKWEEYIEGVDFIISVVGVYDKLGEKYVILNANEGKTTLAAIQGSKFVQFVQAVQKGVKAVPK